MERTDGETESQRKEKERKKEKPEVPNREGEADMQKI